MEVKLEATIRGLFGTTTFATGAATAADSLPTCVVLEQGTALGYAPTVASKATGLYEVQLDATAANGFDVGKEYTVYVVVVMGGLTTRMPVAGISAFIVTARARDDLAYPQTTGRGTLVAADGSVSPNWADVKSPTTTLNLSGTTVKTATDVATDVTTLLSRLSATRAGYLDNLSAGAVALASALATAQTDLTALVGRLTSTRAGYLDNLSGGAVGLQSTLVAVAGYIDTEVASILAAVDTEVADIKAKTDNLPSDPADASVIAGLISTLSGAVAGITVAIDEMLTLHHGAGLWGRAYPVQQGETVGFLPYGTWNHGHLCDDDTGPGDDAAWGGLNLTAVGSPIIGQVGGAIGPQDLAFWTGSVGDYFEAPTNASLDVGVGDDIAFAAVITDAGSGGTSNLLFAKPPVGDQPTYSLSIFDGNISFDVAEASSGQSASTGNIAVPTRGIFVVMAVLERATNKIRVGVRDCFGNATMSSEVSSSLIGSLANTGKFQLGVGDLDSPLILCNWMAAHGAGAATGLSANLDVALREYARRIFGDDVADLEAVKAKTDNLPSDPADASDIAASFALVATVIDAIDAKTTNLPSDPADESLIIAATTSIASAVAGVAAQLPAALSGGFIKAKVMGYDTGMSPAPLVMEALTADYSSVPGSLAEAVSRPIGAVIADAGNTTLTFKTDITSADANAFKDAFVRFLDGANINQVHKVTSSAATTGFLTFTTAFTAAPADGDRFVLING